MRSVEEVQLAARHGAHAVGFVSQMPTGSGIISDDLIRDIVPSVPTGVRSFLLTSRTDPEAILGHQRHTGADTIQLVDRVAPEDVALVKRALPDVAIVQVIHVNGPSAVAEAASYARVADALLLDSGTPDGPVRALGGTGRTHDWKLSRRIVEGTSCPVYLAGGLDPENVEAAIREVRPFGVDLCSGLRPHGHLDETLLGSFMDAVDRGSH